MDDMEKGQRGLNVDSAGQGFFFFFLGLTTRYFLRFFRKVTVTDSRDSRWTPARISLSEHLLIKSSDPVLFYAINQVCIRI